MSFVCARAILAAVALAAAPTIAAAEPEPAPAPPLGPRVIQVPTAWVQPRGGYYATAGADHRGGLLASTADGLGGFAEIAVEVGDSGALGACDPCRGDERAVQGVDLNTGTFKIGVATERWSRGRLAIGLGFTRSLGGRAPSDANSAPQLAELYLAASVAFAGGVRLHGGAAAWAAEHRGADGATLRLGSAGAAPPTRPFAGLEWTPTIYPRTTLLADLTSAPELAPDGVTLRWLGGWGVRYQALRWGSIELTVRHREGDDLSAATVLVRVNAFTR